MPSEIDILRTLDPEPDQPSSVDIQRAITSGRRRRAARGVGYTSVAAVTALAVAGVAFAMRPGDDTPSQQTAASASASASAKGKTKAAYTIPGTPNWTAPDATAPTSCTLEQLPVPDNVAMALVSGADPTGKYIVGRSYPHGGYQPVIWTDGQATKVPFPGTSESGLEDVNSSGTAVGWSYLGSGQKLVQTPYAYAGGKVVQLKGGSAEPTAINDAGAVVGTSAVGPTDAGDALVWPSVTSNPVKLPVPGGVKAAVATDIDEDGTTVGNLDLKVPYVWFADGTHHALTMPKLDGKTAASARVFSIRNGWASGLADVSAAGADPASGAKAKAQGASYPVRWNVRSGEVEVSPVGAMKPDATNAQGWQVGVGKDGHAVLVADGETVVLPDLAKHTPNGLDNIPNTITDDGKLIGGQSDDAGDTIHAVVWRCK